LEGEVFLDAVDRGEVVVFYFAELEEARFEVKGLSLCLFSYFTQVGGASWG
jgi:hypothetical protein